MLIPLPPGNPPLPVGDHLEPLYAEQVGDHRSEGLHRLLLHHAQGEAQRDHPAQHGAEPGRLLQLGASLPTRHLQRPE